MKLRIVTILLAAVTLFTFAAAGCDNVGDENASQSVTSDETQFLFEKTQKFCFLDDFITSAGTEEEAKPISERALSNPSLGGSTVKICTDGILPTELGHKTLAVILLRTIRADMFKL
jgi:hypothetical protein